MFPVVPFIVIAYLILYVLASPASQPSPTFHEEQINLGPQLSLDVWIREEKRIALHSLLANISPFGINTQRDHVAPGTVIASPSKDDPDYFYQWTRDAAITLSTLVTLYAEKSTTKFSTRRIEPIMKAYAALSGKLQRMANPSGGGIYDDDGLRGLGEPKFNVDGSAFTGNWGRPQRDGPALRAITLISYLHAYNASHPELWSRYSSSEFKADTNPFSELYSAELPAKSVIKADLEYVAKYWNESDGFDLWEEVQGQHFFTSMAQLRALRMGANLAENMGDQGARKWYWEQADRVEEMVKTSFWRKDGDRSYLVETEGTQRSGLDCGTLLGAVHGMHEASPFMPWSDKVLSTLLEFVKVERERFPINQKGSDQLRIQHKQQSAIDQVVLASTESLDGIEPAILSGTALGRYPEDVYTGTSSDGPSNPWFLCTSTASQILSLTATHLLTTSHLNITKISLPFWSSLLQTTNLESKVYTHNTKEFNLATKRLRTVSDEFLAVIRKHSSAEGTMSEQFDRATGYEKGAKDLTWSYGAFLEAVRARDEPAEALRKN
jgi:glucoamylase